MSRIQVAIVDDSSICRERLREILEAEGDIVVVADLADGRGVVPALERTRPRVLLTDLVMPGFDGLEVVSEVMRERPLPILIVSAGGFTEVSAFEALRLGALEVAKKPEHGATREEAALRAATRRLATAFVIRHPGRIHSPPPPGISRPEGAPTPRPAKIRALGVGASAGGPPAVAALLGALPPERAPAVLVAQHMPRDHVEDFAGFLARRCRLRVEICRDVARLEPGRVFIAGDGMDLVMTDLDRVAVAPSASSLTPSVDALLLSMARHVGSSAAAVILSGIGDDGAKGMAALRAAGALTIAQDERSCAVYGMPRAAAASALHLVFPEEAARLVLGELPGPARPAPSRKETAR